MHNKTCNCCHKPTERVVREAYEYLIGKSINYVNELLLCENCEGHLFGKRLIVSWDSSKARNLRPQYKAQDRYEIALKKPQTPIIEDFGPGRD